MSINMIFPQGDLEAQLIGAEPERLRGVTSVYQDIIGKTGGAHVSRFQLAGRIIQGTESKRAHDGAYGEGMHMLKKYLEHHVPNHQNTVPHWVLQSVGLCQGRAYEPIYSIGTHQAIVLKVDDPNSVAKLHPVTDMDKYYPENTLAKQGNQTSRLYIIGIHHERAEYDDRGRQTPYGIIFENVRNHTDTRAKGPLDINHNFANWIARTPLMLSYVLRHTGWGDPQRSYGPNCCNHDVREYDLGYQVNEVAVIQDGTCTVTKGSSREELMGPYGNAYAEYIKTGTIKKLTDSIAQGKHQK